MVARDTIAREFRSGLIVSCQTEEGEPPHDPAIMAATAVAAVRGGAAAIRVRGEQDIRAVAAAVSVPIVGLTKRHYADSPVYITPTWDDVVACLDAGADIVAIDATARPRPDGLNLAEIVRRARARPAALLMADIASLHDGEVAAALGFDLISTTLAGYTAREPPSPHPDLDLVAALAARLSVPVIAEGRITTPAQAAEALRRGAWAVCVGKAITSPRFITALFVQAMGGVPLTDERYPDGG